MGEHPRAHRRWAAHERGRSLAAAAADDPAGVPPGPARRDVRPHGAGDRRRHGRLRRGRRRGSALANAERELPHITMKVILNTIGRLEDHQEEADASSSSMQYAIDYMIFEAALERCRAGCRPKAARRFEQSVKTIDENVFASSRSATAQPGWGEDLLSTFSPRWTPRPASRCPTSSCGTGRCRCSSPATRTTSVALAVVAPLRRRTPTSCKRSRRDRRGARRQAARPRGRPQAAARARGRAGGPSDLPPAYCGYLAAVEDDEIDGFHIPPAPWWASWYVLHRHPDHWEAPMRFDPGRFRPSARAAGTRSRSSRSGSGSGGASARSSRSWSSSSSPGSSSATRSARFRGGRRGYVATTLRTSGGVWLRLGAGKVR